MSVITPALYEALEKKFGKVLVASPGEGASIVTVDGGKTEVLHSGETYRVCCPWCGDTRHRLYINHRWYEFRHLIHCFNDTQCMKNADLRKVTEGEILFHVGGAHVRSSPVPPPEPDDPNVSVDPPGHCVPLVSLPPSDPAIQYLVSRNFDPVKLYQEFAVGVCVRSEHYSAMTGRIYVPMYSGYGAGIRLKGWQGRWPADPPPDPNTGKANWKTWGVTKYYNRPGFRKSRYLYGSPNSDSYRLPFVVLVEGVTDVWRIGPAARGYLGVELSQPQRQLVVDNWGSGLVLCMGDGEAQENNSLQADALEHEVAYVGGRVARVELPTGVDPGALTPDENWDLIMTAAGRAGVTIRRPY